MIFKFKHFLIEQNDAVLKVGTDAFVLGALLEANQPLQVLDIGSGTGVLSLIAAQKFQNAHIDAVEIDQESARLAERNFSQSPWKHRFIIHPVSIQEFNSDKVYDLIVSNPPFFENSSLASSNVNNRVKHNTGLTSSDLISSINKLLSNQGQCWLILSIDFLKSYLTEIEKYNLQIRKEIDVYGKPGILKRKVLMLSKQKGECITSDFVIRNAKGKYTDQYIRITKDLHDRDL